MTTGLIRFWSFQGANAFANYRDTGEPHHMAWLCSLLYMRGDQALPESVVPMWRAFQEEWFAEHNWEREITGSERDELPTEPDILASRFLWWVAHIVTPDRMPRPVTENGFDTDIDYFYDVAGQTGALYHLSHDHFFTVIGGAVTKEEAA